MCIVWFSFAFPLYNLCLYSYKRSQLLRKQTNLNKVNKFGKDKKVEQVSKFSEYCFASKELRNRKYKVKEIDEHKFTFISFK